MMIGGGVLLFAAMGGYLVLERAQKQKGSVRAAGRFVGWLAIVLSVLGLLCQAKTAACGGGRWGGSHAKHGWQCPFSSGGLQPPAPDTAQ